jgi:UTP--glucose-1-phosphate uridylyltransferase
MQKITKAVIPVAGLGTRFLPATKVIPKELLPIVDKPALQYVIEEAFYSGLSEIILVTNPLKSVIEEHFSNSTFYDSVLKECGKHQMLGSLRELNANIKVTTVFQDKPLGLGHAVLCAREVIGNEWFVVMLPDMLMDSEPPPTLELIKDFNRTGKSVILAAHAPREMVSQYGIIDVDVNAKTGASGLYKISGLVEKPKIEEAPSDLFIAGRYLLPPTVFTFLEDVKPGSGGEIQLTDALKKIVKSEGMFAREMKGVLHDTGDKLGYLKANLYYGMKREGFRDELRRYLDTL